MMKIKNFQHAKESFSMRKIILALAVMALVLVVACSAPQPAPIQPEPVAAVEAPVEPIVAEPVTAEPEAYNNLQTVDNSFDAIEEALDALEG